MTISTTASRISYNGNGATTAFSFPYRFLTNADLTVIKVAADGTETTLVLNTNYTVTGADDDAGGTVTLSVAPLSGQRLVIYRAVSITQEVDYITGDPFPAETHERALDRLTMVAQQQQDAIDRSAKLSETSTADADTLIANINSLAAIEDDVSAVAAIDDDVSDVAAIDANVTTVAGIAANVTTVAGIAANVTTVAGIAANVTSVAGNATNINTVAGISAAVTAVAADATDIGTVSTNIASVNSAATNMAAIIAAPTEAANAAASALAADASADAAAVSAATINLPSASGQGLNMLRQKSDVSGFEYRTPAQVLSDIGAINANGLFKKADPTIVAWTKTGNGTATTSSILYVEVNNVFKIIASGTSITMPTLTAGTDYAIWCKPDGTLESTSNHTSPPVSNSRKVGGFHYAAGGNATGTSGGNTTAQINEYSFWDLKWRPSCSDPRGMTLVGGGFWIDIYLTGVDAITNGSSKYNVTMADGSSPPKVPSMFGGNGSTTYGSYTWFEAMEMATAFGKKCPTQQEFMSAMYGTTEASSIGSDQGSTILNAAYTSKWGVMQSTGVLYIWARDRGGPYAAASWNANTEGRGSEYNAPNACFLGGAWVNGSLSGSRCSFWSDAASTSNFYIGSRFSCDHLQLD
jgi:hypothetical protein